MQVFKQNLNETACAGKLLFLQLQSAQRIRLGLLCFRAKQFHHFPSILYVWEWQDDIKPLAVISRGKTFFCLNLSGSF